ncbi:MAG: hypothetical protein HY553_05535 [Elusimicrobia bacterium]|nr:hypothetical protein [Elusimicrobiota bacterium]
MTEPDCPTPPHDDALTPDPRLLAEGWTRRFLAAGDRAEEGMALYRSLGFEVRAERPSPEDLGPDCKGCAKAACEEYVMIYTRPKGAAR